VKIIFLGTPAFAVPTLERIQQSHHRIAAVISQPDRARSRGLRVTPTPVKQTASAFGIPVLQPEKASSPEVVQQVRLLAPDAAIVVAYGQILKREFLSAPRLGCINLHASLLPKYRGPSPIQAALLAGDRETGVSTMLLNEGMDTGDILLQRKVSIADDDTAGTLHDRLSQIGASLMVETLDGMEEETITLQPQDATQATITKKITKEETRIDWNRAPEEIHNRVRAFNPWPGSETLLEGKPLKIWRTVPAGTREDTGEPGEVLAAEGNDLVIQASGGTMRVLELQLAGGKRLRTAEFLRGHPVKPGVILGS